MMLVSVSLHHQSSCRLMSLSNLVLAALYFVVLMIHQVRHTHAASTTDFINCNDPCNGGDVNYELVASIRTMPMQAVEPGTYTVRDYVYRGRTYSKEGSDTFMGETMHVKPGQSLWIKLRNNMYSDEVNGGENDPISSDGPSVEDYWKMLQQPGEKIKYQYYKKGVDDPSKMIVDWPNIPKHFDSTNLHLHGLDVEVHMFDPVNTSNPDAPHISIDPGQCYCYKFNIPKHQPDGLYWYHPHLHGATAIQIWGGMLGLLYVHGVFEEELLKYNIVNTHEFVIWDPAFRVVENKKSHELEVDEFLKGQTTLSKIHPFLVNGKLTPNFDNVGVGEVLHFRALCGTIENENTFIVYKQGEENLDWNEVAIPFYIVASDGVTYNSKPKKHNIIIMAGGQREEIFLQFEEPGTYVISQQGIQGMQFFDMYGHPHDQILATITVVEKENPVLPTVPISEMVFTPGYRDDEKIQSTDIVKTETIVFSMGANRNEAPFPQYFVNGLPFHPDRIDFTADPGDAVEYILINANHNVHPFHIHVNRFQIQEMGSELSTEKYPVLKPLLEFDDSVWRDTVVVPPNGRARIWVQYKNYTGKTVFHCHFLAHEDTGMMSTLFIGPEDYVFRWKDNEQWIFGIVAGCVVSLVLIIAYNLIGYGSKKRIGSYEAVAMNELKAKAQD